MPFDPYSEMQLAKVYPPMADKIRELFMQMQQEGVVFKVTQGLRTMQEQADLYAKGRTLPGPIVTNAPAGSSWHQFGVAIDLVPIDQLGKADWNPKHPVWQQIINAALMLRLFSGSKFRTFPDYPHLQMTGRFGISPNQQAKDILKMFGVEGFWKDAFNEG